MKPKTVFLKNQQIQLICLPKKFHLTKISNENITIALTELNVREYSEQLCQEIR